MINTRLVQFKDSGLEQAIKEELNIGDRYITEDDMKILIALKCSNKAIKDIFGLRYAVNLAFCDLSNNIISDITELSYLKELDTLDLRGNEILDIYSLSNLEKLKVLVIDWYKLTRIFLPRDNHTNMKYSTILSNINRVKKFGHDEKVLIEKYLFNATKEAAISLFHRIPKASIFIKDMLREDEILDEIRDMVKEDNRYDDMLLKGLLESNEYSDLTENLVVEIGCNKSKKYLMERLLGQKENENIFPYDLFYDDEEDEMQFWEW